MTTKQLLSNLSEYYLMIGETEKESQRLAMIEGKEMILNQVKKGITPIKLITDNHITLNL
jgi:hypothetical protein